MRPVITRLNRLRRWQKIVLALLFALVVMLSGGWVWLTHDLPSIDQLHAGLALPSTRIYDRHGRILYEILADGDSGGRNRAIPLNDIPQHCQNAVIATEDANFYRHPGVDVVGIARATWINVRGGEIIAGGSTITQQTARNLLLDPEQRAQRTLRRKLREMILAVRLQNAYSKDEVLALYLNQSYFGNLAYGIEAAAQAYFGKAAAELALSECALLAGLLQAPATYDPLTNLAAAQDRQAQVLDLMARTGFIEGDTAEAAKRDELQFAASPFPIEAPHFVMAVIKQLERDFPEQLYGGGLEVTTTVDLDWQRAAGDIVQTQLAYLNNPVEAGRIPAEAENAAVVAIDPFTGQILTMLGSPDYFDEMIDGNVNAALALRQPGSALKPFTYAAAMNPDREDPWTAATMMLDIETPFVTRRLESYTPANYGLVEHGPVLVRDALASSFNIPAVIALDNVGIEAMVQLASDAGLDSLTQNPNFDLAITLGGGEVRLLDLTGAYSIFTNGGYRVEPVYLLEVRDRDGHLLHEWQPRPFGVPVLDERVAYIITDILSDDNARIPGFGRNSALNIGRPAAAKTGTTTDFKDNWVVGYTPNLVVGVWVGNADNEPMVNITGLTGAGPIWNAFMRRVLLGRPELEFTEPDGITRRQVCALSGLLATPACPRTRLELFVEGTEPTEPDHFYQVFEIDRVTGQLATDATPPERRTQRVYVVLPQEARAWGIRNGLEPPPLDAVYLEPDRAVGLRLLEPDPYTIFQISPVTPIESQQIRLEVGAPPGTETVTYRLNGEPLGTVDDAPWHLWWTLAYGQHELIAEAQMADGTVTVSEPILFRVTRYAPPESRTEFENLPPDQRSWGD